MTAVTIPKHLEGRKDLVAIPRDVYDDLMEWERQVKSRRVYTPTPAELKAIKAARRRYARGQYSLLSEL